MLNVVKHLYYFLVRLHLYTDPMNPSVDADAVA